MSIIFFKFITLSIIMIYFDNNATTIMPIDVQKSMMRWCNMGNPSAAYATAVETRKMMTEFRKYIGKLCGIDPCCAEDRDAGPQGAKRQNPSKYKIIFNSGASESNCTVFHSIVTSYQEVTGKIPHVVMSAIEHKSLYDMAESYLRRGHVTVTYVKPTATGHILPADVEKAIEPNTCLVCVMHANNETGAINDIRKIGQIAHKYNVPFHCDTVQTFGKFPIKPIADHVDSFCISFHKLHGPPGVGALVIKQQLLLGYKMSPIIYGTQNEGLRGGTENVPGIGAAFTATKKTMENRREKNEHMFKLKNAIMNEMRSIFPTRMFHEPSQNDFEIVFLSGAGLDYLPNTILLSVADKSKRICNAEMKKTLESKGIIVSVGSACNTASAKASHVLYAMDADEHIRKGALRISLGDENTVHEAKKFIQTFTEILSKFL